jgi:hypothetical protein
MTDNLQLITYCGLYCELCTQRGRIPQQAKALKETMTKESYEVYGFEIPGFEAFWTFLGDLCEKANACPGCRAGGGNPYCEIRQCARGRGVEICADCADYPCERVEHFAQVYPTILVDAKRLREVGLGAWIKEQEQRAATGFCYADIRIRR